MPDLTGSHPAGAGKALYKPFHSSFLLLPICTALTRYGGSNVPIDEAPCILEFGSGVLVLAVAPSVVLATHTHRHAAFHLFACLIGVSTLYLEWSKMAMKFCSKFVHNSCSAYFFSPFPCRDFSWFSLLKQGVTIAHRFCYLCASTYISIPLVPMEHPHAHLLEQPFSASEAQLMASLWVDLQLSC